MVATDKPIRIVLADERPIWIDLLEQDLGGDDRFEVVEATTSVEGALGAVRRHEPDVLLMDFSCNHWDYIMAKLARERRLGPSGSKILMYTGVHQPSVIKTFLENGASRHVCKSENPEVLSQAIADVAEATVLAESDRVKIIVAHPMSEVAGHTADVLRQVQGFDVLAELTGPGETMDAVRMLRPDVLVMAARFQVRRAERDTQAGVISELAAQGLLGEGGTRVITTSADPGWFRREQMRQAGASGFYFMGDDLERLQKAIKLVYQGKTVGFSRARS